MPRTIQIDHIYRTIYSATHRRNDPLVAAVIVSYFHPHDLYFLSYKNLSKLLLIPVPQLWDIFSKFRKMGLLKKVAANGVEGYSVSYFIREVEKLSKNELQHEEVVVKKKEKKSAKKHEEVEELVEEELDDEFAEQPKKKKGIRSFKEFGANDATESEPPEKKRNQNIPQWKQKYIQ